MPKLNAYEIDRYMNNEDKFKKRSKNNKPLREDNNYNYSKKNDKRRTAGRNK